MIVTSLDPYNYVSPAVGKFSWDGHKHKDRVESMEITIPQVLQIQYQNNVLALTINGTVASLNKDPISNRFHQGPYMDILSHSIEPLKVEGSDKCVNCFEDSIGGTKVKDIVLSTHENKSVAVNISTKVGGNGTSQEVGIGPSINLSLSSMRVAQVAVGEFNEILRQHGDKKTRFINMKYCYSGRVCKDYDVKKIKTLRNDKIDTRLLFGFLVLGYGWGGGWHHFPDETYTPPEAATSSISAQWMSKYSVPEGVNEALFKWVTEVRTVFASNGDKVPNRGVCRSRLNWIKTIHQVTQIFKVTLIKESNSVRLKVELQDRSWQKLCISGYESKMTHMHLLKKDDKEKEIMIQDDNKLQEVEKLFNTPI